MEVAIFELEIGLELRQSESSSGQLETRGADLQFNAGHSRATRGPLAGHSRATRGPLVFSVQNANAGYIREVLFYLINAHVRKPRKKRVAREWPASGPRVAREWPALKGNKQRKHAD